MKGLNLCLATVFGIAVAAGSMVWSGDPVDVPQTVQLSAGAQIYRPAGEFRVGTRVMDAPLETRQVPPLEIMVHQVSEAEYGRCMATGDCPAVPTTGLPDVAQTYVSHGDAHTYAAWLSERTGDLWRLPTDAEWLQAAQERGVDARYASDANGDDPSRRWIASYRREVALRGEADLDLHPRGYFGRNLLGVADMAGNIWEWTETCFQNGTLTQDGAAIVTRSDYCGVRAVQGKHRAFVIEFIRDARTGGCAAGVPPDYLGFRLVRERRDM